MLRETEIALFHALRFPDRYPRVPTIELGTGAFRPEFARRFWAERLGLTDDDAPSPSQ